jgi:hypothetical protein
VLSGLAVATIIAIPWYWHLLDEKTAGRVVYGLPLWALVSILGSFAVSVFTWLLYQRMWPAEIFESLDGGADAGHSDAGHSDAGHSDAGHSDAGKPIANAPDASSRTDGARSTGDEFGDLE